MKVLGGGRHQQHLVSAWGETDVYPTATTNRHEPETSPRGYMTFSGTQAPGQGSPGKLTPSCRRISSMTRRVTTDSPSGRTGDSRAPGAVQRGASAGPQRG